jgi:nucleotide-binding universal stress UspA family protein
LPEIKAPGHETGSTKPCASQGETAVHLQALVPLVTYPEANSDDLAAQAVSVAARLGARLHILAVNADIPDVSNALSSLLLNTPEMIKQAETASRRRGDHLIDLFREQAAAAKVEITASTLMAPLAALADTAAMRARYFDLNIVGWEAGNPTSQMTAQAIVFGSGRPTVLLPKLSMLPEGAAPDFGHVAIAWDGTRVAARAVGDARPFLERAARISVITVVGEKPLKEADAGERLAEGLRTRGLNAEAVTVQARDCPIAETLQQTAIERGCQLLVMGGYGHSRIRDFILGGATQGVLAQLAMPVLLAH